MHAAATADVAATLSYVVQALAACSAAAVFRVVTAAQTRPLVMSLRFQVRRIDGTAVCEIEADEDQECQVLKQQVSDHLGVCKCKIALVAGTHVLRNRLYVKRIMRFVEPSRILTFIEQPIVLTTVADLHARGVCFQCMKELGVLATEILALPIPVDVTGLRAAGFSLEALLHAREGMLLWSHPPVTNRTLFDSQLKAGGFSASDFYRAGYRAEELSEKYFWRDGDDLTPGEIEWEPCCAFFTASELKSAGYDASQLRKAWFSVRDLNEAGFPLPGVARARVARTRAKAARAAARAARTRARAAAAAPAPAPATTCRTPQRGGGRSGD